MKKIGNYQSSYSVNPIISKVDGDSEEKYGNKYLIFASIDKKRSIRKVERNLE